MDGIKILIVKRSRKKKMKAIYFMAVLVVAIVLFNWTKGSPAPKQDKQASLTGTWYGKYHSEQDTTSKTFVIVL